MRQLIETNRSKHFGILLSLLLGACSATNNGQGSATGGTVALGGVNGSSDVASSGGSGFSTFSKGPLDGIWRLDSYTHLNGPTSLQMDYIPIILTISGSSGSITANLSNDGATLGCSCAMNTQLVINYLDEATFTWLYTAEACDPISCDTKCTWGGGVIISCSASDPALSTGSYHINDDGTFQALLQPADGYPWTIVDFNKIADNNPAITNPNATSGVDAGVSPTAGGSIHIVGWSSAKGSEFVNGQVGGVDINRSGVIVYVLVSGGWYNRPDRNADPWPITAINADGTWSTNITPEANEPPATEIAAYLVPINYYAPRPNGDPSLPDYFKGLPSACVNPQAIVPDADQTCP